MVVVNNKKKLIKNTIITTKENRLGKKYFMSRDFFHDIFASKQ